MSTGTSLPTRGLPRQQQMAAEAINALMGTKGTPGARALRVDDLVNLGLVRLDSSGNLHKTELFERLTQSEQITVDPDAVTQLQEKAVTFERALQLRDIQAEDLRVRLQLALANNELLVERLQEEQKNFQDLTARVADNEKLGELLRQNTEEVHASISALLEGVGSVDNVPHGVEYGRPSNLDLVDYNNGSIETRRIGLRVPGGQRIADQRNLPQSNTTSYGAIRTTGALTADSSGNVTVNAHTVRYGGVSVSYAQVVNAVTGLTPESSYVIYCYDEAYAGGTRSWFAGLNPSSVMNLGDGVVVAGQITIPTEGSGGGGGGGGGSNPDEWCVDYDSLLPDGRYLRDLQPGDMVECVNVATGEVGLFPLLGMSFGEEDCFALVTPSLAEVWQSGSTKMDLPDGRVLATAEMFGQPVYTKIDGAVQLSMVMDIRPLGLRRVCKPDFGNRMFFAGTTARATIATHNIMWKP